MKKENVLKIKSFEFAVRVVGISGELQQDKEYVLSKQLLRSGTAIGTLIREAEFAQSNADFIHKLYIALKEANETLYWIDLLKETNHLTTEKAMPAAKQTEELISMLVASIKTLKLKNKN